MEVESRDHSDSTHAVSQDLVVAKTEQTFVIWALTTMYELLTKYTWMAPVIIGVPGNMISIMITSKKANRHISSCTYMTALAVADTMTLLSVTWALTLMHWGYTDKLPRRDREFLYQWIWYVIYLFAILSGLFLAEMSIDRLIAIRFPLSAVRFCTRSRAWKAIIFTTTVVTVLNANVFWTYAYSMDEELGTDTMRASVPDYPVIEALAVGFQLGFGTFIPFSIIIFSNMWIVITVHDANKEREGMGTSQSQGEKKRNKDTKYLTRMLILVSIAYVALSMPYRLYDAIMNLPTLKELYNMRDIYWILRYGVEYCTINEVWYLNFGINFYLYCIGGGRKYRNDVKTVFREMFEMCVCMKPVPAATTLSSQTRPSAIKSST